MGSKEDNNPQFISSLPQWFLARITGKVASTGGAKELRAFLKRHRKKIKVISFDVFDTVIVRPTASPEDIFDLVEAQFKVQSGKDYQGDFRRLRSLAESNARQAARKRGHQDTTLSEIYRELCILDPQFSEAAAILQGIETELEVNLCRVNPVTFAIYSECLKEGYEIVFTSDMYLPAPVIERILQRCGYQPHRLFVSSEHKVNKHSGKLFDVLLKELGRTGSEMLHIGDNPRPDYLKAREKGLHAFHLPFPKVEGAQATSLELRAVSSLQAGLIRNRKVFAGHTDTPSLSDFWWWLGYERAGILFYGFVQWLASSFVEQNNDFVAFLARDGYILKRIYDRMAAQSSQPLPRSVYLFASRRLNGLPGIHELNLEALDFLAQGTGELPVEDYLYRIGIDPHLPEVRAAIVSTDFKGPLNLMTKGDRRAGLHKLFKSIEPLILAQAREERVLLADYLAHSGLSQAGRPAIVDIGWHGSIQFGLTRLYNLLDQPKTLYGYYFGTFPKAAARYLARGALMDGYLFHLGEPRANMAAVNHSIEFFEFLCSAPHGTITGLKRVETGFDPVCFSPAWETEKLEKAQRVQAGVMAFIEDWLAMGLGHIQINPTQALNPIYQLLAKPTLEQAKLIGELPHSRDFGAGNDLFTISKVRGENPTENPIDKKKCFWVNGAYTLRGVPLPEPEPLAPTRRYRSILSPRSDRVPVATPGDTAGRVLTCTLTKKDLPWAREFFQGVVEKDPSLSLVAVWNDSEECPDDTPFTILSSDRLRATALPGLDLRPVLISYLMEVATYDRVVWIAAGINLEDPSGLFAKLGPHAFVAMACAVPGDRGRWLLGAHARALPLIKWWAQVPGDGTLHMEWRLQTLFGLLGSECALVELPVVPLGGHSPLSHFSSERKE